MSQSCLTLMDGWLEQAKAPEHNCYLRSILRVLVTEKLQMKVRLLPLQKVLLAEGTLQQSRRQERGCLVATEQVTITAMLPTVHRGLAGS